MDELMSIGAFSDRTGLSPKRLRSYAAGGLLVPAAVDSATGYRYYAPTQVRAARLIDALRGAGLSLDDVATVLRDPSSARLDGWADQVTHDADQRHRALDAARRLLACEAQPLDRPDDDLPLEATMTTFTSTGRTDIGRVRETNQDAIVTTTRLAAVADGMGGAPGGELASGLATALLEAAFTGGSSDELHAAVRAANRAILDRADADPTLEGMGTTICAAGLTGDGRVVVVNVGDSRAYLVREGTLRQLTEDHSVTAEAVRRGELDEEDALDHPHHGILTRALGVARDVQLDSSDHAVVAGDRLLLCTDGLVNEVRDDELRQVLVATDEPHAATDALVDLAVERGGRDNVSVVLVTVGD